MSTAPASALESHDDRGLSVVTSTMVAANPRYGTVYDGKALAAGMPVYFHPLHNGNYLALFAFRWTDAVMGTTGPQRYSAHAVSAAPCAVEVNPTGGRGAVFDLPCPWFLTGACGRNSLFWTVGESADGDGVIGVYRATEVGTVLFEQQEILPPVRGVTFSRGCLLDDTHLIVFGADDTGKVHAARKNWARIGVPNAADGAWTYWGARGWEAPWTGDDGIEHHPLDSPQAGLGLTSAGPVSGATRGGRVWLSTVQEFGDFIARLWSGKTVGTCRRETNTVPLGTATTYLGGALYFHPQVNASLALSTNPAIPYTTSVLGVYPVEEGYEQSILTDWGLHFVT